MPEGSILITGASSGLGAEMARQFADLGYELALAARRTEKLDELKVDIHVKHPGRRIEVYALDVLDDDAVFSVFHQVKADFGTLDRVIVNAGVGLGAPLGTGKYAANKQTALTNFVAALAQIEAAMEIFRAQKSGHLVIISSVSALRGFGRNVTTYAATKAGVAALGEGLLNEDVKRKGIDVSVIYPGFIQSEMTDRLPGKPAFMVDTVAGVREIVEAVEKRKEKARVPAWPWVPLGSVLRNAPMSVVRRFG